MNLHAIQIELEKAGFDGWLFFDHHLRDPLEAVAHGPNVKGTAISDVYGPHRQKGLEGCLNPQARACVDYRELLADKTVDAVVIATPDHWHCPMVLDAVPTGKDIYCK